MKSILIAMSVLAATSLSAYSQQSVRVGTNSNGAPWSFHDAASNSEKGVSVELIEEIAKDAGLQIQLVPMAFGELIAALNAKKCRHHRGQSVDHARARSAGRFFNPDRAGRRWFDRAQRRQQGL
ncbi:MAG TPA: transporter substrate-binding domain-containing protein [Pseudolabrys sp.]|nr:transporter substrate-binding domain-containing protein [Pseudolabrys sp.]